VSRPFERDEFDVAVVGAGLAGLRCAEVLAAAGRRVALLEGEDEPGGRVRTEQVDGHLLDRGFQVLFEAYPEAQAALDLPLLEPRRFEPGADVALDGRLATVADPRRVPRHALATLRSGLARPADLPALVAWRRSARHPAAAEGPETTGEERLAALGLSEPLRERFLRPLFAGIFLERRLDVSSHLLDQALLMMATGPVSVPAGGMGAIPAQLASRLPPGTLRTGARVEDIGPGRVVLSDGRRLRAATVVVATDPPTASRLTGLRLPAEPRATTCLWFDAPLAPAGPRLVLDGTGEGPVNNLAVMSAVAPTYAPAGRHTIAASCLGLPSDGDDDALDRAARRQLSGWFGPGARVASWRLLRVHRIRWAQHAQPPGTTRRGPQAVRPGLFVAGDGVEDASIEGALRSGRRVAEQILALGAPAASAARRRSRD
jgi:phytoene dehydrogenase-like protein